VWKPSKTLPMSTLGNTLLPSRSSNYLQPINYLNDWIEVRGPWTGALFCPIDKADRIVIAPMSPRAIYNILHRRLVLAGVKAFTPHDLRRTFAGDLLDTGAYLSTVQKLMGHSNANTTEGYDRRDAKAIRATVNKLHIPYIKKNNRSYAIDPGTPASYR
jgi:integrase